MPDYSLCVITPTIGRDTLRDTLQSAALSEYDQWLVLSDGEQPAARAIVDEFKDDKPELVYIEVKNQHRNYGNYQRDLGMRLSDKDFFIFMDDDDIFVPDAIDRIRREINGRKPKPVMFRMIHYANHIIWQTQQLAVGNIGGTMFVVPNIKSRLGKWSDDSTYQSDFMFIESTLKKWPPQSLLWCGDIIAQVKGRLSQ